MSFPTNTPPVFAPYAESCGDALECWPQFPMDRSSENCPHIETPLFKKPKISETVTNLRMPGSNNKVMTDAFFKTQLCMKFRLGTCINGDECNFAHGTGDIRRPLPHGQELSCKEGYVAGIWNRDHRLNSKMKLCRIFSRGEKCPYGERCNFLHEGFEKCREGSGKFRESSSISVGCTGSARGYRNGSGQLEFKRFGDSSLNANQVNANPGFWRTRLCHKWEMSGNCAYREKCVFAHGQAGILPVLNLLLPKLILSPIVSFSDMHVLLHNFVWWYQYVIDLDKNFWYMFTLNSLMNSSLVLHTGLDDAHK